MKSTRYLEDGPVVLQNLLLHLHQLRDSFVEGEELWGDFFLLQAISRRLDIEVRPLLIDFLL